MTRSLATSYVENTHLGRCEANARGGWAGEGRFSFLLSLPKKETRIEVW